MEEGKLKRKRKTSDNLKSTHLDNNKEISLESYRRRCRSISRDFNYGETVYYKIEKAESIAELERIMTQARQNF